MLSVNGSDGTQGSEHRTRGEPQPALCESDTFIKPGSASRSGPVMHTHRSGVLSGWPKAMGLIQPAVWNQGGTSEMLSTKCAHRGSREAPGIVGGAQGHLMPLF